MKIPVFVFSDLLKTFRKRKNMSQQGLADHLGTHRNTIGYWERGDFLPESRTTVLEIVRVLGLDEQEARQLLEASLTALSPYWSVPYPRNPLFTGREEMLEKLRVALVAEQAGTASGAYAVCGMGGVGKTQLALEYAYQHALEYKAVFWIEAETEYSIALSMMHIAETLQLPEQGDRNQQQVIMAVQRWLATHSQWLLIWDNIEDLALLNRFLPTSRQGTLLLTTRRQALGTLAWGLELLPMEREQGILFLLRRTKVLEPAASDQQVQWLATQLPAHYAAATELVEAMGGLPLALDQAGAYIEEAQCGLSAYLELFRIRRAVLLQQRGEDARDHLASVATTFRLSITAATLRHPAVWEFLGVCALLHPDAIPEKLFRQGAEHLGATLRIVCRDELEWNRVVAAACASSLLSRQPEEQTLTLHRLVQAVLLDAMTKTEREQWSRQALEALEAVFPLALPASEYTLWRQCQRLLPHALVCLERAGAADESLALASLAYKAAHSRYVRGEFTQAEPLYQRALSIRERLLGPDHPLVAASLHALAGPVQAQGKYAQAEALLLHALRIYEQAASPDTPALAYSLHELAFVYWQQGKYAQAEPLYRRALHIREQFAGSNNHEIAYSLHNLALLFYEQGKAEQAKPLYQRAWKLWVQSLGPDHPSGGQALNNLANIYRDQCKFTQAEALYQRARQIWEQSLGPDHLWVAYALHGQALLFQKQGRDAEAESLFQRTLALREQQLSQYHPETAQALHDLALFRQAQGNLAEAFAFAQRALSIRTRTLGDAHPKTLATQALYAQLVQEQG